MGLSNAERQRRWRERHTTRVRAHKVKEDEDWYDSGLPEPAPVVEPPPPGAYYTPDKVTKPKAGHYEAKDGTFPPIPDDIIRETITTTDGEVKRLEEYQMKLLARHREAPVSDDRSILFE